jgi:acyl-CoA synthetase (AMP-forming)/AMP-acid ligase II
MMNEFEIYSMCGVPYIYEKMLLLRDKLEESCKFLKYCYCAGGVVSENLINEFRKVFHNRINFYSRYGGTEFMCGVWTDQFGYPPPLQGKYFIKDTNSNNFLGAYEKGEILIDSENIMLEYLGEGDKSSGFMFIDGKKYVRSGDVGYLDENGNLHYVDRLKRTEKVCGNNIFPAEIETIIKSVDGITNCVVARKHYENGRPFLTAYLELNYCVTDINQIQKKICETVNKKLNKYSVPRRFVVVDEIKKTNVRKNDFVYYENLES